MSSTLQTEYLIDSKYSAHLQVNQRSVINHFIHRNEGTFYVSLISTEATEKETVSASEPQTTDRTFIVPLYYRMSKNTLKQREKVSLISTQSR